MCMKDKKQYFIERANKIHNNFYDYSFVAYKNANTKIIINCTLHGKFEQYIHHHLRGSGCSQCGKDKSANKQSLNKEQFRNKSLSVHGNLYNYDLVNYINYKTPVLIVCKKHGEFMQKPSNHLSGSGCYNCDKDSLKITVKEFIDNSINIHKNIFDYSNVIYSGYRNKVEIICSKHGVFTQSPHDHLNGNGCPKCALEQKSFRQRKSIMQFIYESNLIHKNKYNYSSVEYINSKTKVNIICPIHGGFKQAPTHHINGIGCPSCSESKGEMTIANILNASGVKNERQKRFDECKYKQLLPFDFYLPEYNICIEYDGKQHFYPLEYFGGEEAYIELKKRDEIKNEFCIKNNIFLLRVGYKDNIYNKINQLIKKIMK